jgi:hypothetical protein
MNHRRVLAEDVGLWPGRDPAFFLPHAAIVDHWTKTSFQPYVSVATPHVRRESVSWLLPGSPSATRRNSATGSI